MHVRADIGKLFQLTSAFASPLPILTEVLTMRQRACDGWNRLEMPTIHARAGVEYQRTQSLSLACAATLSANQIGPHSLSRHT